MVKTINKYITTLNSASKTLLVLSSASSGYSLCSFTTVIGTIVGIVSTSSSLVFLISNGVVKMFLKTMGDKKKTHKKLIYWL